MKNINEKKLKKIIKESVSNIINEQRNYEYKSFIHSLKECQNKGMTLNEALEEGIFGGIGGFFAGPMIGKKLCDILGVKPDGVLGKVLQSNMVGAGIGSAIGDMISQEGINPLNWGNKNTQKQLPNANGENNVEDADFEEVDGNENKDSDNGGLFSNLMNARKLTKLTDAATNALAK